jgi:hypothetical protein
VFADRDLPSASIDAALGRVDYRADMRCAVLAEGSYWLTAGPDTSGWLPQRALDDRTVHLRHYRELAARVMLPYTAPPQPIEPRARELQLPSGSVLGIIAAAEARLLMARTALKLRAIRARDGGYPETFATPIDPFDGKPIRYLKLDDGFVLWTVYLDGRDYRNTNPWCRWLWKK